MKKAGILVALGLAGLLVSGCVTGGSYTDGYASQKKKGDALSMGLDRQDFEDVAESMIQSMLSSPAFTNIKPGTRKVIYVGRVKNDTPQRIDTDRITRKLTIALLNSGKFIVSSELQAGGSNSTITDALEESRNSDEFNQKTVIKKGTAAGIDFELEGKIGQTNTRLSNGKTQVEYFFNLRINDANSRTTFWEDEKVIDKTGSSKSVTW
ncbi:penicillin-binding protein activator LpoB [Helicobacter burdigaliensis]|uniref:penicillin-binding protein activator LpoB n=1 Tax=Helicobacter burdigaliensis TaxID=2315334 RepID=UPI000EF6C06D|nr:penicillin-binding protein activator LpoB [Helicobacter burdigaliensis]